MLRCPTKSHFHLTCTRHMFWWWLKPRFYSKCLSYVKFIRTRLETIQKRRKAVQKFMKSDIADLLRRGDDYEAYKRAERLLLEQKMLSCYELIEKFNGCISDHLEDLTKQKECPDECKEAIPSLMYAAARFADLPELRDLRTLFTEKFGNSLDPYLNKEFFEKLKRDSPTREMKIQLLYDIAQEFSIEWNDRALRQRLYTQTSSLHEEKPKRGEEHTDGRDINTSKGKERDTLPPRRKDFNYDSLIHQSISDDETSTDISSDDDQKGSSSSLGSVFEEEEVEVKRPISYWLISPPYIKQDTNKDQSNSKKTTDSEALPKKESNQHIDEPVVQEKTTPRSVRRRHDKTVLDQDSVSGSKTYPSQQPEYDTGQNRRRKTSHVRGASVPNQPTTEVDTSKGHIRTISLETGGGAWHVHPKLPNYDDLAARFAALKRGREIPKKTD